jgi:hypothetical protein
MAATFCWRIRYALTPLFGTDFPSQCIHPGSSSHGCMKIDGGIVDEATKIARLYRDLELQKARSGSNQRVSSQPSFVHGDRDRQRVKSKFPRHSYEDSIGSARDSSSEPYCHSPQSPPHNPWTPVNGPPRSSDGATHPSGISPRRFFRPLITHGNQGLSGESDSETDVSFRANTSSLGKGDVEMGEADSGVADVESDGSMSDTSISEDDSVDADDEYRGPVSRSTGDEPLSERAKKNPPRSVRSRASDPLPPSGHFAHEVKAAHALLHLHMQEANDGQSGSDEPTQGSSRTSSATSRSLKRRCASL